MRYILRKLVLEQTPEIEIPFQEFEVLKNARCTLSNAFEMEQKYEIVISNFLDLEKELLNISANNVVRTMHSYHEMFETISILNTRVVNLLMATRLYFDQVPQHLKRCNINNTNFVEAFKRKCSYEYDNYFEFRFMEALRNHVQHHGMPIHHLAQSAGWTSFDEKGLMEYSVKAFTKLSDIKANVKFKKSVLKEISSDIDLIPTSRKYIESISVINDFVRELIDENLSNARQAIEDAHKRYSEVYSETLYGLSALEIEDSVVKSHVPLLLDWDDVRIKLIKKNPKLVNFSKRYVTNRA